MEILIIGGTQFVGRALTSEILSQGHNLTLFHRGKTNPDIFTEVERIQGDRDGELTNLGDRSWDVVIDTCGYIPRIVQQSVDYLKDKVKQYVFISSISVYTQSEEANRDETAALATLEDETVEEITGETYGGLKVLCENVVLDAFKEDAYIIRPGLIVGPNDPTNRFTYWPVRIRSGGNILSPPTDGFIQIIDARDLAKFIVKLVEDKNSGIYNATSKPYTLDEVFGKCVEVTGSDAVFQRAENQWLIDNKVGPWMEMPLWIPGVEGQAMMQTNVSRGVEAGLAFRPIEQIIEDTLAWYDEVKGNEKEWAAGMKPEKEQELLGLLNQ